MSIMPVQNVNLNNRSVTFQGRHHHNADDEMPSRHHSTMPIKAIPVIALIAMSPMTNANKAFATEPETNNIEMVSTPNTQEIQQAKSLNGNEKVISQKQFEDDYWFYKVNLISTDNNMNNFEKITIDYKPNYKIKQRYSNSTALAHDYTNKVAKIIKYKYDIIDDNNKTGATYTHNRVYSVDAGNSENGRELGADDNIELGNYIASILNSSKNNSNIKTETITKQLTLDDGLELNYKKTQTDLSAVKPFPTDKYKLLKSQILQTPTGKYKINIYNNPHKKEDNPNHKDTDIDCFSIQNDNMKEMIISSAVLSETNIDNGENISLYATQIMDGNTDVHVIFDDELTKQLINLVLQHQISDTTYTVGRIQAKYAMPATDYGDLLRY